MWYISSRREFSQLLSVDSRAYYFSVSAAVVAVLQGRAVHIL
jgi:hypothetical protein